MSAWSKRWPAPAKLNLMLKILGRRDDGYHRLQTVFQFIDVCDYLTFSPRTDGAIKRCSKLKGVAESDDLVVRAARLLQKETATKQGVDITVEKFLPMGGGLGGGSSDAATVLFALNSLWECGLTDEKLAAIGLSLGADVPVFLFGKAAWGEGVGENLQAISLPEPHYVVIIPPCHVSTAEVFSSKELTRDSSATTIRAFLEGDKANDCLTVVKNRYLEVAQALDFLASYAEARLTGTGACVFAEFADKEQAEVVVNELPDGFSGFVTRGLNHSPLQSVV